MYTVGSVPYVNARPLVWRFENPAQGTEPAVRVVYDLPSRLPALLDSGGADAVLASSFDAITTPERRVAFGVGIVSRGKVESVRLFSKVPFEQIRSLALDEASLTSNHLAQIVLLEQWGIKPTLRHLPSRQADMLAECDACVLIGDAGMAASSEGLHVLDLGEAWTELTGLPFVWALWIGKDRLGPELAALLNDASNLNAAERDAMIEQTAEKSGWEAGEVNRYLSECIRFTLGTEELEGLEEFGRKLVSQGLVEEAFAPSIVSSDEPFSVLS